MKPKKLKQAKEHIKNLRIANGGEPINLGDMLAMFRLYRFDRYTDAKKAGLKLKWISDGLFRNVYQIEKLPLVIKFPKDEDPGWGANETTVKHSEREVKTIRAIKRNKKMTTLHRYLPKIHYYRDGIVIMDKYTKLPTDSAYVLANVLQALCEDLGIRSTDLHSSNVGENENGDYAIIDWGFIYA